MKTDVHAICEASSSNRNRITRDEKPGTDNQEVRNEFISTAREIGSFMLGTEYKPGRQGKIGERSSNRAS